MLDACIIEAPMPRRLDYTWLPEGALAAASVLRDNGFSVEVYPSSSSYIKAARYLIIFSDFVSYDGAIRLACSINSPTVVICGDYVTTYPQEVMMCREFHYGIRGDPEDAIVKLLSGERPQNIQGIVYMVGSKLRTSPILDLGRNRIPIPDYGAWKGDINKVVNINRVREYRLVGGLWKRRGKTGMKRNEDFLFQLRWLRDLGVVQVVVVDDNFCGGTNWVILAVRHLNTYMGAWSFRIKTETLLDNKLSKFLPNSKCRQAILDVGSGSNDVLSEIGRVGTDAHERAFRILESVDIMPIVEITVGWPSETERSMVESRRWLESLNCRAMVRTFTPIPGTLFYERENVSGRYKFLITGTVPWDFHVDDTVPVYRVPWESGLMDMKSFLSIRNEMIEQFNTGMVN